MLQVCSSSRYKVVNCNNLFIDADKSISHRALILASFAKKGSYSIIYNLLVGIDVLNTIKALQLLGVEIYCIDNNKNTYIVESIYNSDFIFTNKKNITLSFGNSGTSCRLLMGALAAMRLPFNIIFTGDSSLCKRPMDRVIIPLTKMGAKIKHNNYKLPITILKDSYINKSTKITLTIPSAQVKSAILLGNIIAGTSCEIIDSFYTRNHSENMIKHLNLPIKVIKDNILVSDINNGYNGAIFNIMGDFSSAAFFIALGLLHESAYIVLKNINLNPTRIGLLSILKKMGANIKINYSKSIMNERVGDIIVKSSKLKSCIVPNKIIPFMIDEIPILAVIASFAKGETIIKGVEELKYKESNRIEAIIINLSKFGVIAEYKKGDLYIKGSDTLKITSNITVDSFLDHRIAMSFIIMGLFNKKSTKVINCDNIETSFPSFFNTLKVLNLNVDTNIIM